MGRRRQGPVKANARSDCWYARLTVPPELREKAGKTRLIRSLKTTSHAVAMSRYSAVYAALERELEALVKPTEIRGRIELNRNAEGWSPVELTEAMVGFNYEDPTPQQKGVYTAFSTGKPLALSWPEAIDLWIKEKNRSGSRPLAPGSIQQNQSKIKLIEPYGQPHQITKAIIRQFIDDQETLGKKPLTISGYLKSFSAITDVLVRTDYLDANLFKAVPYSVSSRTDKAPFNDDEVRMLFKMDLPCKDMILTGLRPGELEFGQMDPEDDSVLIIKDLIINGKVVWRPKTLSSYRHVVLPPGFVRPKTQAKQWRKNYRKLITDPNKTLHSGRHTFIELYRRAGADPTVMIEYCGHGSTVGSSSHQAYGTFTDDVLRREAQKVWKLMEEITN